jgi:hypothetical protein
MFTTLGVTSRTSGASVGTFPLPNSGICATDGDARATEQIIARMEAMGRAGAGVLELFFMTHPIRAMPPEASARPTWRFTRVEVKK